MFFAMKHEREKGKVTQNLPFYCLEISENSDYRSSLRTHPFLLRSIFSVNKAKIPSLRVSSLTIPVQCIDQSFLINEAKMHPSSTILHLPFIPRINRTPFHRSKNKNSTPYEKYPLYKISVYLFLFFFYYQQNVDTSNSQLANAAQSRVNYSCLRPISRELISVTRH